MLRGKFTLKRYQAADRKHSEWGDDLDFYMGVPINPTIYKFYSRGDITHVTLDRPQGHREPDKFETENLEQESGYHS